MATSSADTSLLLATGPIIKSAAADPLGRPGLKELVLDPLKADLESVMDGTGLDFSGPQGSAASFTLAEVRILARTAAATYVFQGAEAFKLLNKASPFRFANDLTLPTDGTTDATALLNAGLAAGGSLLLDVPAGLVVTGPLNLASGGSVGFSAATTLLFNNAASLGAIGYFKENYRPAPLALSADVAQSATVFPVDTTPAGGGAVSGKLAVGERLVVRSGANLYEGRITAVDDTAKTATCGSDPIPFAAPALASSLTTQVLLHLDSDTTGRVLAVRNGELGRVSPYDHVLVLDDTTAGASGVLTSVEAARVVGIQTDGANTITLDRPLRRSFKAASNARVQVLAPVVGASVTGAKVRFTQAPSATRVDTFVIGYAVGTVFEGCRVLNEDSFGSRGQGFRVYRGYRSGFRDAVMQRPKYTGSGEGHGFSAVQSTECFVEEARFESCRSSVRYEASTDCWADRVSSSYPLVAHVMCEGANEQGCCASFLDAEGGVNLLVAGGLQGGGQANNAAGSFDCYVEEVESRNPTGAHVQVAAPSSRCGARRFAFRGGANAIAATDHGTNASLVGADNYLDTGRVYGPLTDWAVLVDGGVNTGTARGQLRPTLTNVELIGCDKSHYLRRCTGPLVSGGGIRAPVTPQTDAWAVRAQDASGLEFAGHTFRGVANVFNLTNCPSSRAHRNTYVDLTGGAEYSDGGGNTGTYGAANAWLGFSMTSPLPS